jgi:hypothetical protein
MASAAWAVAAAVVAAGPRQGQRSQSAVGRAPASTRPKIRSDWRDAHGPIPTFLVEMGSK